MLLHDWMLERGLTDAALSRELGCTPSTTNRIRRGLTMPEAGLIARIVALSSGQVTANDLFAAHQAARETDPAGAAA